MPPPSPIPPLTHAPPWAATSCCSAAAGGSVEPTEAKVRPTIAVPSAASSSSSDSASSSSAAAAPAPEPAAPPEPPAAPAAVGRLYFAFLRLFSAASVSSHGAPRSGRAPTLVHGAEPKSGPSQMLYVQRVPAVR